MKKFAVIGDPIKHSMSPIMHNWIFKYLNIHAEYEKIMLKSIDLPNILDKVREGTFSGINVTIPHKEKVLFYLDEINPIADEIKSVNCIVCSNNKLIGDNTDWYGFKRALIENKIDVYKKEIILIGSGGVSKAILYSLKELRVQSIILLSRKKSKIKIKNDNIIKINNIENIDTLIKNNSIIINATPIGMNSNEIPIKKELINKNQVLIDVIYNPLQTSFIKRGNSVGARTLNGLDMFIYQGIAALDLWFGRDISKQVNFTQIKSYLEAKLC